MRKRKQVKIRKKKKLRKMREKTRRQIQPLREKHREKTNLYAKASETKRMMFLNQPMIILLYKEA